MASNRLAIWASVSGSGRKARGDQRSTRAGKTSASGVRELVVMTTHDLARTPGSGARVGVGPEGDLEAGGADREGEALARGRARHRGPATGGAALPAELGRGGDGKAATCRGDDADARTRELEREGR